MESHDEDNSPRAPRGSRDHPMSRAGKLRAARLPADRSGARDPQRPVSTVTSELADHFVERLSVHGLAEVGGLDDGMHAIGNRSPASGVVRMEKQEKLA